MVAVLLTQKQARVFRWFQGECCIFTPDAGTMTNFPVDVNELAYRLRYMTIEGEKISVPKLDKNLVKNSNAPELMNAIMDICLVLEPVPPQKP